MTTWSQHQYSERKIPIKQARLPCCSSWESFCGLQKRGNFWDWWEQKKGHCTGKAWFLFCSSPPASTQVLSACRAHKGCSMGWVCSGPALCLWLDGWVQFRADELNATWPQVLPYSPIQLCSQYHWHCEPYLLLYLFLGWYRLGQRVGPPPFIHSLWG